ncbi:aspartate-semialdehyde dehydrogenase [Haloplasma contractile]|uniref:Aspartate-semialdehyde dehydrogenase n=1 Tax=Haloplasma contractile SSD-17B TaxID=1033810 RepID=U2FI35_9MOLU|nr:aspartate-semialdehyde dehydrogenase [Haloplasma contractile]ERJ12475.1 Aspartate-semialdehyde dehydrogenase protein [Haloplasma contractile SSD-17B]
MKKVNLAIVGATGMVGRTFMKVLEERQFPVKNLYLFASKRSEGTVLKFNGMDVTVEALNEQSFNRDIDIALFSAGGEISKRFAKIARDQGVVVIDNSSAWRMDPDVPLIVPEVNALAINNHNGIIANPNCSTIQSVLPLKYIDDAYGIKRIIYSTYQAVSGSGVSGIQDLEEGLDGELPKKYEYPIAYNCIPQIDIFMDNGYTKEEMKMINETRKILNNESLKVTATAVRVPVKYGHSVSINLELEKDVSAQDIKNILNNKPGIVIVDDPSQNKYPMAIDSEGNDEVYVGRIRKDYSIDRGINLWVVADNIRKGAATNTVQIAELLLGE